MLNIYLSYLLINPPSLSSLHPPHCSVNTSGVGAWIEQPLTNMAWIGVSASLGFVAGVIIGIIIATATVNRRKFRWNEICFSPLSAAVDNRRRLRWNLFLNQVF